MARNLVFPNNSFVKVLILLSANLIQLIVKEF